MDFVTAGLTQPKERKQSWGGGFVRNENLGNAPAFTFQGDKLSFRRRRDNGIQGTSRSNLPNRTYRQFVQLRLLRASTQLKSDAAVKIYSGSRRCIFLTVRP